MPKEFLPPLEASYSRRRHAPTGQELGRLTTADGISLRTACWLREEAPLGTIIVLGGRGEFIEKYYETIADLKGRGFSIHAMDWRGQGLSDRLLADSEKGHVHDFADYVADLDLLIDRLPPDFPRPLTLLGHSLGGHNVLRYLIDRPGRVDRAVLLAPMLGIDTAPLPHNLLRRVAQVFSLVGLSGVQFSDLRSERGRERLTSDPDRGSVQCAPTFGWLDAAFRSIARVTDERLLQRVTVPVLTVVPGADRVTGSGAAREAAELMANGHLIDIPGAQHEILMERDQFRDQFWKAFDVFSLGARRVSF